MQAESTFDAARLYLTKPPSTSSGNPSLETVFEVTVNGRVYKVTGQRLQRWITKQREERKGPRRLLFNKRPMINP